MKEELSKKIRRILGKIISLFDWDKYFFHILIGHWIILTIIDLIFQTNFMNIVLGIELLTLFFLGFLTLPIFFERMGGKNTSSTQEKGSDSSK